MKKPVCEICNCQSFVKKNGIFECTECGTQYSLVEIKNLLVDVFDEEINNTSSNDLKIVNKKDEKKDEKKEILCCLNNWYDFVKMFNEMKFFFNVSEKDMYYSKESLIQWYTNFEYAMKLIGDRVPLMKNIREDFLVKYINKLETESDDQYSSEWEIYNTLKILFDLKSKGEKEVINFETYYFEAYEELDKYLIGDKEAAERACKELFGDFKIQVRVNGYSNEYRYNKLKDLIYAFYNEQIRRDFKPINTQHIYRCKDYYKYLGVKLYKNKLFGSNKVLYKYIEFSKINNEFLPKAKFHIEKAFKEYVEQGFLSLIMDAAKQYEEIISYIPKLEAGLHLPVEYRTEQSIIALIKLFRDGKVETMKEAMNLYDTQIHRDRVIEKLGDIESYMQHTKQLLVGSYLKLEEISNGVKNINVSLNKMYEQNKILLSKVKSIEFMEFLETL